MSRFLHALPSDDESDASEEFVALLTQHQQSILAFILGLMPNRADADESLQRTNIVLWRKREDFEPGTSFRSWAFAVARWEARGFLRERGRSSWLVYDDEVSSLLADRMASIPTPGLGERALALRKCIGELGKEHQQLVIERYQNGLTFRECAKRLGRSEGGLRVTLHRLRVVLRKCVVRRMGGAK